MSTTTSEPTKAGRKAPAFKLKDQDGNTHALSDFAGKPVVLFFYPKDDTSGCTQEACDFRNQLPAFEKLGTTVLGISILNTKSKAKFAKKNDLNFPLLADDREGDDGKPDPAIAQKYGVWVEKSMYGRTYMGIERTTFLIDAQGKVARVWSKVKVPGHVDEVAEALHELD